MTPQGSQWCESVTIETMGIWVETAKGSALIEWDEIHTLVRAPHSRSTVIITTSQKDFGCLLIDADEVGPAGSADELLAFLKREQASFSASKKVDTSRAGLRKLSGALEGEDVPFPILELFADIKKKQSSFPWWMVISFSLAAWFGYLSIDNGSFPTIFLAIAFLVAAIRAAFRIGKGKKKGRVLSIAAPGIIVAARGEPKVIHWRDIGDISIRKLKKTQQLQIRDMRGRIVARLNLSKSSWPLEWVHALCLAFQDAATRENLYGDAPAMRVEELGELANQDDVIFDEDELSAQIEALANKLSS